MYTIIFCVATSTEHNFLQATGYISGKKICRNGSYPTASMAGEEVECPVCGKNFASNEINTHVNLCLSGQAKCETADRTRKDESLSEPHEKRRKVDVVKAPALEAGGGGSRSTKSWTFMMKTKSLKSPKAEPSQQFGATVQKEKPDEPNKSVCNTKDPSPFISVHSKVPLAERMRPVSLDEYVGQEQALGRKKLLRSLFEAVKLPSMIFWGPPGCGKVRARRCSDLSVSYFRQECAWKTI